MCIRDRSKTALQTILLTTRCDGEVIHERRDTLFGGRLPADVYKRQRVEFVRPWRRGVFPYSALPRAGRSDAPHTVSYTHLDVYKRQVQHQKQMLRPCVRRHVFQKHLGL